MEKYYIKTDFCFSDQATKWLTSKFANFCNSNFEHDLFSFIKSYAIESSLPGKELSIFLKNYGIKPRRFSTFISNSKNYFIGNPHIDFVHFKNEYLPVISRFNIVVLGNADDKMAWWDKDVNLEKTKFTTIDNKEYFSYAVPGENPDQRWNLLGTPTFSIKNNFGFGSFVRTNCIHTVSVSPGPRLVLTAELDESLDVISKKIKYT